MLSRALHNGLKTSPNKLFLKLLQYITLIAAKYGVVTEEYICIWVYISQKFSFSSLLKVLNRWKKDEIQQSKYKYTMKYEIV